MIRLLDLPDLPEIEARFRLNGLTATRSDPVLDDMLEAFTSNILGVRGDVRQMIWETIYFGVLEAGGDQVAAQNLANARKPRTVSQWLEDGWDVRGDDGNSVLCLAAVENHLLCITAGLAGKMKIEIEQSIWASRKQARSKPSPAERAKDLSFLELGQNRASGPDNHHDPAHLLHCPTSHHC